MTMFLLLTGSAAAFASYVTTPLVIRLAHARNIHCMPGGRRIHREPVPRLGGVAILAGATMGLGSAVLLVFWHHGAAGLIVPLLPIVAGVVLGGAIAFGTGLVDDLRSIRPTAKLAAQVAAALLVYWIGFRIDHLSWGDAQLALGWAALPLTLLWIVGVTNAYNLVDGMDGLATGMGIVAFAVTALVSGMLGHFEVTILAVVLLGALAGFLPHNFNPARIFMGDCGSLFVGFVLAVLSVQGSMKSATAVLVVVPLFALAIPLLDTFVAIVRRWLRGLPISSGDARHIHHRLVARGFSHRDAVLVLYVVAVGFASLGILLAFVRSESIALVAAIGGIGSAAVLVTGMRSLGYDEFLLAGKVVAAGPRRARRVIRDRILAGDLAAALRTAGTVEEIQDALARGATDLGLLHMEVCTAGEPPMPRTDVRAPRGSAWTMDFPVCGGACGQDPLVLRLSARVSDERRVNNAERVAHVIGAALRDEIEVVSGACEYPCSYFRERARAGESLAQVRSA